MNRVLQRLSFVMVDIDYVVILLRSIYEQVHHCREVFARIALAGLKIKVTKCSSSQFEIKPLGHIVNTGGIHEDVEKIKDILKAPVPTNANQLRSLLGLVGNYLRLICNFAECSAVLHAATSIKRHFRSTSKIQKAFKYLERKPYNKTSNSVPRF